MKIHHGIPELIGIGKFDKNSEKLKLADQCEMITREKPKWLDEIDESKYIFGICRCQADYGCGLTIIPINDLTEYDIKTGKRRMHCDKYDIDCIIHLCRRKNNECKTES